MVETDALARMIRITNCLQTILELEPELKRLELGDSLFGEFVVLKTFLEKIDTVDLCEADVQRIERATANFLEELRGPLAQAGDPRAKPLRLQ
jgi:hypothetical protein